MVQNCESVTNIYSQLFPRLERTNQVLSPFLSQLISK